VIIVLRNSPMLQCGRYRQSSTVLSGREYTAFSFTDGQHR